MPPPLPVANYYISNGIKNLRLDVKIEYVGVAAFGQLAGNSTNSHEAQKASASLSAGHKIQEQLDKKPQFEAATISWQQKLIHPLKRVSLPKVEITATDSDGQEHIHQQDEDQNGVKMSRIFTYVNSELESKKVDSKESTNSTATGLRKRKVVPISKAVLKDPIAHLNSKQQKKNRIVSFSQQTMNVMAYFGSLNKTSDEIETVDEKIICSIVSTNNQTIKFVPDLGTHQIESRYGLYNVSVAIHEDVKFDVITDVIEYVNGNNKDTDEDAASFNLPGPQIIWMQYLITIEEAINFPNDGVYVEYTFELPSHVRFAEGYEECASGRTHICFTKSENDSDVAKFSFPIEAIFEFRSTFKNISPIKWPHLLVKVMSEDYWQRCFVNGYGQLALPTTTGKHRYQVYCWRPVNPDNHASVMKDYLLGQAVDIHSIENQGIVNSCINNTISNVSILSETSGTLIFSIHCLRQSRQLISTEVLRSIQYGSLLSKVGLSGSLHWRIMKVLMQFEEARRQLLHIRSQNMPKI